MNSIEEVVGLPGVLSSRILPSSPTSGASLCPGAASSRPKAVASSTAPGAGAIGSPGRGRAGSSVWRWTGHDSCNGRDCPGASGDGASRAAPTTGGPDACPPSTIVGDSSSPPPSSRTCSSAPSPTGGTGSGARIGACSSSTSTAACSPAPELAVVPKVLAAGERWTSPSSAGGTGSLSSLATHRISPGLERGAADASRLCTPGSVGGWSSVAAWTGTPPGNGSPTTS